MSMSSYLTVNWPENSSGQADNVHAVTTLINGGTSKGGYAEYNLAMHVADDPEAVKANRSKLLADLQLPAEPVWLDQVHSNRVVHADTFVAADSAVEPDELQADASVATTKGVVCAVLTADCLPVFFCNSSGTEVAVAHAGWRGLHAGIITNTVNAMRSPSDEILVSLGPAIGAQAFEVGEEVFSAFVDKNMANASAFVANKKNHYLCDIYRLARTELQSIGIDKIAGGGYCTYRETDRFYSYRRQPTTGRMASLIWMQ